MKIVTITLSKPGHQAAMTATYRDASWPAKTEWTGERSAFKLSNGSLPTLTEGLDRLEETVAFQAKQSGATFEISDDGGEAPMRGDEVLG